jgi:hypothetical protein
MRLRRAAPDFTVAPVQFTVTLLPVGGVQFANAPEGAKAAAPTRLITASE